MYPSTSAAKVMFAATHLFTTKVEPHVPVVPEVLCINAKFVADVALFPHCTFAVQFTKFDVPHVNPNLSPVVVAADIQPNMNLKKYDLFAVRLKLRPAMFVPLVP
jgi:hypothetical protein